MFARVCSVLLISLVSLFGGHIAFAASEHIPISELILPQLINVLLVVALLTYLTKKVIREHFKSRREEFTVMVRQAASARDEAEATQRKVKDRLSKLEANASEDLQRVKSEAESLKRQIIEDAKDLGLRLETEAHRSAQYEVDRATFHLREELLEMSVSEAESQLKKSVDGAAQKRLQNEFVENIQAVR